MHYKNASTILTKTNGINIYRGCQHDCIYCDSRSRCYNMNHPFTDIEVKQNALELLDKELSRKRNPIMVGTGSMCDPYMQLEKELEHTRKSLEIIYKNNCGVTVQTKSDLILRDMDLFKKINKKTRAVIQITLTVADEELSKKIEPNVCTSKRRYEVLKEFQKEGIETIVWLCPFLPYITDTLDNLKQLLFYCKDANVKAIIFYGFGLTLREGNREYFYEKLDKLFPGMKEKYIRDYGNSYNVVSRRNKELEEYFITFCKENNIKYGNDDIFKDLQTLPENKTQLSLF